MILQSLICLGTNLVQWLRNQARNQEILSSNPSSDTKTLTSDFLSDLGRKQWQRISENNPKKTTRTCPGSYQESRLILKLT